MGGVNPERSGGSKTTMNLASKLIHRPTERVGCMGALMVVSLLTGASPAAAEGLSGDWTEVWTRQSVSVASWGDNCGDKPKARGRRAVGKTVKVTDKGGVLRIAGASDHGLVSNACKYTSMASKVSYGPYVLTCSTPAGSSPMETATYRFSPSDGGKTLRYRAKITQYLKLKGDVCKATLTYQRLFTRIEAEPAVATKPAVIVPEEVEVTESADAGSEIPRKTVGRSPPADEAKELSRTILIPVSEDGAAGPSGGQATTVISTRRAAQNRETTLASGWWLLALVVIALGFILVVVAGFLLGRRRPSEPAPKIRSASAGRVGKVRRSLYKKEIAKTTLMSAATVSALKGSRKQGANEALASPEPGPSRSVVVQPQGVDRLDTTVSVRVCPRCERRYDIGATFCPQDGATLEDFEDRLPLLNTASPLVCTECGKEQASGTFCPEDGARLVSRDPDADGYVPMPVVVCPRCHREFLHGEGSCPDDGEVLLPVVGRKTGGLPMTGIGPKSKICAECGTRYSSEATFCGKDGSSLVNLN